jgi:cyclohexanone monooxygenase
MDREATGLDGLELDVAVIGTGFGGIYALKKTRDLMGLNAQAFDDAGGVGGTWYWNRYPGCRVDTESHVYQYSFDPEFMKEWVWTERYPAQPEVLKYLNAVADRHDLKRSINFDTRIVKAEWSDETSRWTLTTKGGQKITAQFVIEAVGLLSSTKFPEFDGEGDFKGEIHHAARWPKEGVALDGRKVAVIGTGSTGTQMLVALAPQVKHLYVMQRTPQYVVPLGCGPTPREPIEQIARDPAAFRDFHLNTAAVFGFTESTVSALEVPPEKVEEVYENAWQEGNGFAFMLKTFSDVTTSEAANKTATDFIRGKIAKIVKDPEVAEKLMPGDFYAKRPLATDNYYETFNRDNVTLVDVKEDPIARVVPQGLELRSGRVVEVDVIIYATGFDAITGNYLKIDTTGTGGLKLADKWASDPTAMMGMMIAGFPNLFSIYGPFSPFTSQPLVHEWQVDWIGDAIATTRERGAERFEVTQEAEQAWVDECNAVAAGSLFSKTDSWINGSNVEGKPRTNYFYMSGMASYMRDIMDFTNDGYRGFVISN